MDKVEVPNIFSQSDAISSSNEPQYPQTRFRFSPEELRILKECNRESFYYRSLPLAAASVMAVHFAVRKGFLKPHPRWGSTIKFIGASLVGWFLGKVSYQSVCEEKFMHLPNSSIGEALRKKKGYDTETITEENPIGRADEITLTGDQLYSYSSDLDYSSSSRSPKLDTDKNVHYVGVDDGQRPTLDNSSRLSTEDNKPTRSHTTYEDLRKKNREEYEIRQIRPYQSLPSTPSVTWDSYNAIPSSSQSSPRVENAGSQKNVYGDAWED